ncbi:molybdopterin-dependent oxidoreductase [Microbacterium rhizomatis]|uniref:Molybdopterin-dependent oxidoreductase n=1 Tax=Microbacterium rhizomatis TaxID=1631477 RepID=A0A5J5J4A9_9MICO|nr:molybdopterin-dependent oxidoreductase [Microbacterium rhizomatis]KAA9108173.1 molybdopterin-dependent oxidoreductase [Microbacterium rhizomatis]
MGAAERTRRGLVGAIAGVAAVIFGAGIGELAAAILSPGSSPFAAIGSALIDFAPPWAKETAIGLFGTNDKAALLVGIAIVLLIVAGGAGILEQRLPPWGRVVFILVGIAGAVAALTRADAGLLSWIPSILAGVGASVALWMLVARAPAPAAPAPASRDAAAEPSSAPGRAPSRVSRADDAGVDRRRFLLWSGGAVAIGVFATIGGATLRAGARSVEAIRAKLTLPTPAAQAPAIPASAELGIPGLSSVVTPNASFYRIDTALIVPQVDPADWSLRVYGMVENEFTLTWDELLALPLEESVTTLTCVSNAVGGDLIGNALWLGHPIRALLARAKPTADADMVLSRSIDGFTASSPLEALTDDRNAILAVGMNGDLLPAEHGFPVRMVVPGLYGYVSATKWVTELQVMRYTDAAAYWTQRGWSERGPIKLESRIDVPRKSQGLKAGDTVIAGVAWQQHVGVSGVEVQIDEGDWMPATLATAISDDTWVQWSIPWTATAGDHLLRCRAISATGEVQTGTLADVVPDGATGWNERFITVFA